MPETVAAEGAHDRDPNPPSSVLRRLRELLGSGIRCQPVDELTASSATWRVTEGRETLFLKRVPRTRREPFVIEALGRQVPTIVPAVLVRDLAAETGHWWFVLADAGPLPLEPLHPHVAVQAAKSFGILQRCCATDMRLLQLLPDLAPVRFRTLLEDFCAWARSGDWSPPESARLRTILSSLLEVDPALDALAAALEALPLSVVHGDLFARNLALRDGRLTLIDWGDAFWGSGGVAIVNLIGSERGRLDDHAEAAWTAFAEGWERDIPSSFKEASGVAHAFCSLLLDQAVAECVGRPPQSLAGLLPDLEHLARRLSRVQREAPW